MNREHAGLLEGGGRQHNIFAYIVSTGGTEFATDGTRLALHASERSNPERGDLERIRRTVPREVFGARIAQYVDPDGLARSVGEESVARGGDVRQLMFLRLRSSGTPVTPIRPESQCARSDS